MEFYQTCHQSFTQDLFQGFFKEVVFRMFPGESSSYSLKKLLHSSKYSFEIPTATAVSFLSGFAADIPSQIFLSIPEKMVLAILTRISPRIPPRLGVDDKAAE